MGKRLDDIEERHGWWPTPGDVVGLRGALELHLSALPTLLSAVGALWARRGDRDAATRANCPSEALREIGTRVLRTWT